MINVNDVGLMRALARQIFEAASRLHDLSEGLHDELGNGESAEAIALREVSRAAKDAMAASADAEGVIDVELVEGSGR